MGRLGVGRAALIQDPALPFFATLHPDGQLSMLVKASRRGESRRDVPVHVVEEAWLSRAGVRARTAWLRPLG